MTVFMILYNITKCAEVPWTIEVTHGSISQLMKAIIGSGTKGIVKFFHKPDHKPLVFLYWEACR